MIPVKRSPSLCAEYTHSSIQGQQVCSHSRLTWCGCQMQMQLIFVNISEYISDLFRMNKPVLILVALMPCLQALCFVNVSDRPLLFFSHRNAWAICPGAFFFDLHEYCWIQNIVFSPTEMRELCGSGAGEADQGKRLRRTFWWKLLQGGRNYFLFFEGWKCRQQRWIQELLKF